MQNTIPAALFAGMLLLASPSQGQQVECVGDCDQNGSVDVSEVVMGLSVALGSSLLEVCPTFDGNRTGEVDVSDLVGGVSALLNGCARTPAAPTLTATPSPTAMSTPSADDLLAELTINRATWEGVGAVRYRMLERLGCFCFRYPRLVAIEVVDDQIVSIRDVWTGAEVQNPPENLYRTVDGIFELIAEAIESRAERLSVEYDQFVGAPIDTYIAPARFDDQIGYSISDMTIWRQ